MDVEAWLEGLGLKRYAESFRDNDIDAEILRELTPQDLRELGVGSVGHRRLLLKAIAELRSPSARATATPEPFATTTTEKKAERRYLTVMFVDLVGSTQLAARLDPEDMQAVIRDYQNAVAGNVARFDGHIAKFMGDGVLVYFGWPRAHEDAAERAARVGLDLVDTVARLQAPDGTSLAARIGIATGLVVVGDLVGEQEARERTVVGETPNLAARLQSAVGPSQVVVSDATKELLRNKFELVPLEPQNVKGIDDAVIAFLVHGERNVGSRFEATSGPQPTALIGRDQELALLLERWDRAKSGEGQCVVLFGEAGIGKSRITSAMAEVVSRENNARILFQCSPFHADVALWPIVQHLNQAAGLNPDDSNTTKFAKLESIAGQDLAQLMANFFGLEAQDHATITQLDPQARRARTLSALAAYLEAQADRDRLFVVFEDAHWIDPTTKELVDVLLHRFASKPVVLLLTTRPNGAPEFPAHSHLTRLALNRLGRESVEAIVHRIGGTELSDEVIAAIVARTDGVPLFVEEMTKAVMELGDTKIPAALQDWLMARLDRTADAKAVAQVAACVGRDFDYSILYELVDVSEDELDGALERLVSAELVFQRGAHPHSTFTFKHALVRDAAYESLLRSERALIHGRLGSVLEQRLCQGSDIAPELIAQHFFAAGETERCIEYWLIAGHRARARYANLEATVSFNRALEELRKTSPGEQRDRRELELRLAASGPTLASAGYTSAKVAENSNEIVALARKLAESELLWLALYDLARNAVQKPDLAALASISSEIADIAEDLDSNCARFAAAYSGSTNTFYRGQMRDAKEFVAPLTSREVPLEDEAAVSDHFQAVIGCRFQMAWIDLLLGHLDSARQLADAALRRGHDLARPFARTFALQRAAIFATMEQNQPAALQYSKECLEVLEQYPLPHWQPWLLIIRGWAHAMDEQEAAARADLEAAWLTWHNRKSEYLGAFFRGVSAEAFLAIGDLEQAELLLREAAVVSTTYNEHFWDAELLRIDANRRHIHAENFATVEAQLLRAVEISRAQDARTLQLRSSLDLARHWIENGRRQEVLQLLEPQVGWFAAGAETTDISTARKMLSDLR